MWDKYRSNDLKNQRLETLEREQRENWTLSSEAFHLEEKGYKQVGKKAGIVFGEQTGLVLKTVVTLWV